MDARIPSLLQFGERRISRVANGSTQITFRRPLRRALGHRCLRSNDLQPHCQQCHLKIIADEFFTSLHSMEWATCLQRQCNRSHMWGVGKSGRRSCCRFAWRRRQGGVTETSRAASWWWSSEHNPSPTLYLRDMWWGATPTRSPGKYLGLMPRNPGENEHDRES